MRKFTLGLVAGFGAAVVAARLVRARFAISFEGRVVVITGGSRGLGLQIAESLGEAGARVVVSARKTGELEAAVALLKERGVQAG